MANSFITVSQPQKEQQLQLDSLTDTEGRTLLAMMVSSNDKEAIALAPIGSRRYYQLKPKLQKAIALIKNDLSDKSWQILTGSVIKAAQTLAQGLDQPSYRYRIEAAKNILDRVLGEPTKRVETKGQITILGIDVSREQIDKIVNAQKSEEDQLPAATNNNLSTNSV